MTITIWNFEATHRFDNFRAVDEFIKNQKMPVAIVMSNLDLLFINCERLVSHINHSRIGNESVLVRVNKSFTDTT